MTTELDERSYIYWTPVNFSYNGQSVCIRLEETFTNKEPENLKIGSHVIKDVHKIEKNENSKMYDIIFNDVHFFQAYDELRHIKSDEEQFDEGVIRKYTKSNLLNYIEKNTTFKTELEVAFNNFKHYCVRTSADWFDIITTSEPVIKLIKH